MIFDRLFEKRNKTSYGNLTELSDFWYSLLGRNTHSGVSVNRHNAMGVSMVVTCVLLRSNTLASFPLKVKRKVGKQTEDAKDHPLYNLLRWQPNSDMKSWNWRQAGQTNVDLTGNEYGWIDRSWRGVKGIWPIPSENVKMVRASGEDVKLFQLGASDRLIYVVQLNGKIYRVPAKDMLHFIGSSLDGISGVSVISYASNTIGNKISLDRFQGQWMEKGMHVSGVLSHPEVIKHKDEFLKNLKSRYGGSSKAGTPLVLEEGMSYNQIKVSLADQQFIEQSNLSDLQIARMFQMPPSRVGIQGVNESNNSLENENRRFLDTTMLPIVVSREEEMTLKLLTPKEREAGYFIKFNYDALLRPDTKSRAEIDQMYFGMGMPLNRMLERDDLDPVEGGDESYVPLNFAPAGQVTNPPPQPDERIAQRWEPVINATVRQLVGYEANAVGREVNKNIKNRANQDFTEWQNEFYGQFEQRVISNLGLVVREYMLSINDKLAENQIDVFNRKVAKKWVVESKNHFSENVGDYQKISAIVESWRDNREDEITKRSSKNALKAALGQNYET